VLWVLLSSSVERRLTRPDSFAPLVLHQLWLNVTGYEYLGSFAAFQFYFMAFNTIVIRQIHCLRRLGHIWGFLDGDQHERDGVPDVGVGKVAASLYKTTGSRMALAVFMTYNPLVSPADVVSDWTWWAKLSLQIGLYSIVLDFWFYWYHRAMHDVSPLWKFHRKHHLTKHPNPLLAA
jgi:sterol desaturase/sphingolipid hydroxylase (fatty acid hydroxylase superfamily)